MNKISGLVGQFACDIQKKRRKIKGLFLTLLIHALYHALFFHIEKVLNESLCYVSPSVPCNHVMLVISFS